jgi:hypothetical protein
LQKRPDRRGHRGARRCRQVDPSRPAGVLHVDGQRMNAQAKMRKAVLDHGQLRRRSFREALLGKAK